MKIEETARTITVVYDLRLSLWAAAVPLNGILYGLHAYIFPILCKPPTGMQLAIFWAIWVAGNAVILTRTYYTGLVCDKSSNLIKFARKRLLGGTEERTFSMGEVKNISIRDSVWENLKDVLLDTPQGSVALFTLPRVRAEELHRRLSGFITNPTRPA